MRRDDAWTLVQESVDSPGLRAHMLAVEAAMRRYADILDGDGDEWGLAGLLHDWDWEIHPSLEAHPADGAPTLREKGCPETVVRAILSHNTAGTGVERERPIDYALLACDDITGLIAAATLVRPSKDVRELPLSSVEKRWGENTFAGGVDRDHVREATADFSDECFDGGLELWEHVGNVLEAMRGIAADLNLDGRLAGD